MNSQNQIGHVSDTAYWVASYRAEESERPDRLFDDPLAKILVGEKGKKISQSMKSMSRYSAWGLVIRTRLIDEYLADYIGKGITAVINLGAGLDTRPYRLNFPPNFHWVEIDFPATIEMKNEKLKNEIPKCHLERIALDLSDQDQRRKTLENLNDRFSSILVLTEGVIPYLTEPMVGELASELKSFQNFKFWIVEYFAPQLYRYFKSPAFTKKMANSPFQFFPENWFEFFKNHGWQKKEARYLNDEGERLRRRMPLPWFVKILNLIFGPKKMAEKTRFQAYVVMEKS